MGYMGHTGICAACPVWFAGIRAASHGSTQALVQCGPHRICSGEGEAVVVVAVVVVAVVVVAVAVAAAVAVAVAAATMC